MLLSGALIATAKAMYLNQICTAGAALARSLWMESARTSAACAPPASMMSAGCATRSRPSAAGLQIAAACVRAFAAQPIVLQLKPLSMLVVNYAACAALLDCQTFRYASRSHQCASSHSGVACSSSRMTIAAMRMPPATRTASGPSATTMATVSAASAPMSSAPCCTPAWLTTALRAQAVQRSPAVVMSHLIPDSSFEREPRSVNRSA